MIDTQAVKENLQDWLENPSWKEVYDGAPSEECKEYIAMMFYASETEEDEAFDAMDELESELPIRDLRYLYSVMTGPEKARLGKKIADIEE